MRKIIGSEPKLNQIQQVDQFWINAHCGVVLHIPKQMACSGIASWQKTMAISVVHKGRPFPSAFSCEAEPSVAIESHLSPVLRIGDGKWRLKRERSKECCGSFEDVAT